MTALPASFPSPAHLPFNATSLESHFRLAAPDLEPAQHEGVWAILRGSELLVRPGETPQLPAGPLPEELVGTGKVPLYIGDWRGQPCRVLPLSRAQEIPADLQFESLLAAEPALPIELLSLGGLASQILHWEKNSRHCSRCGETMSRITGEWGQKCGHCDYAHYPHIHPCVITLIRRPGEVLLTRKAAWPANRYSLVAGFLDFGECLEEAVAREALEETGVRVENIRYIGSQSWPFPSQLMTGFVADWAGGEVKVQEDELEDARWFPVDALPNLPPKRSIARYILDTFVKPGS